MPKGKKKHHVSQAVRKRRGRNAGVLILGALALVFIAYLFDRSGPLETIDGLCVDTRSYTHTSTDGEGPHTHVEAVLEYERHRYALRPGDRFKIGEPVTVEIRRGRLTRYPYFEQAYHPRP